MYLLIIALISLSAAAIDFIAPALHAISTNIEADYAKVQLLISAYSIAYAVALLFVAPLCERFGRAPVLISGLVVALLSTLLSILTENINNLVLLRVIQGASLSVAPVIARSMAYDLFSGESLKKAMSTISVVSAVVPLAAPIVATAVLMKYEWSYLYILLSALMVIVLLMALRGVKGITIADKGRATEEKNDLKSKIKVLFENDTFVKGVVFISMSYALILSFVSLSSKYFVEVLSFTQLSYSIVFSFAVLSFMVGSWVYRFFNAASIKLSMAVLSAFIPLMFVDVYKVPLVLSIVFLINFNAGLLMPYGQMLVIRDTGKVVSYAAGISTFIQLSVAALVASLATYIAEFFSYEISFVAIVFSSTLLFFMFSEANSIKREIQYE